LGFIGLALETLLGTLFAPPGITSLIANIQQIGLNAVPIIMLLTFWWGSYRFLGATVLTFRRGHFYRRFGVFSST
jgi:phospholipid/cholesterol/gamma-HCH transport system permease protein